MQQDILRFIVNGLMHEMTSLLTSNRFNSFGGNESRAGICTFMSNVRTLYIEWGHFSLHTLRDVNSSCKSNMLI